MSFCVLLHSPDPCAIGTYDLLSGLGESAVTNVSPNIMKSTVPLLEVWNEVFIASLTSCGVDPLYLDSSRSASVIMCTARSLSCLTISSQLLGIESFDPFPFDP